MIIIYYLFEKLHSYYYKYCANCKNEIWGKHTAYKEANKGNKFEKYNDEISTIYRFLFKFLFKFRYKLCLYFPEKKEYKRYFKTLEYLTEYEVNKYFNFFDKIILKNNLKNAKRKKHQIRRNYNIETSRTSI